MFELSGSLTSGSLHCIVVLAHHVILRRHDEVRPALRIVLLTSTAAETQT